VIPKYEAYPEGRLFHVATFGGPEKIMKPFGDHLVEKDRWLASMHLRRLMDEAMKERAAKAAAPAATPAAPAAAPSAEPAAPTPAQPAAPAAGAKS
jgi:pyruvate/2-oxoglutarate dehydrogenase complex dihydrolipoamide acyltransferase (E2) component